MRRNWTSYAWTTAPRTRAHGIRTTRETDALDPAKANYGGRTAQLFGEAAYALLPGQRHRGNPTWARPTM